MSKRLIVDADVLIDYLREEPQAVDYLESLSAPFLLSVITVAELYAGVREGEERRTLDGFVAALDVLPVEKALALEGGLIRRDYYPSHGTGLADALIAATVQRHEAQLATLNEKHFPMLDDVIVPYRKR